MEGECGMSRGNDGQPIHMGMRADLEKVRYCVFCGSSPGRNPEYQRAAKRLGSLLAREGIGLVYGGASVGLMGILADAVLDGGGEVIGVIPQLLMGKEVAHRGLTELRITESMHQRKAMMAELSQGFIALPGGIGTLEETFEILTWAQLGYHTKPCALLNIAGFYNPLISFLNSVVEEEFLKPVHREMIIIRDRDIDLLTAMRDYVSPITPKWIGKAET